MNPAKTIADQAEAALRLFFAETREDAARLLDLYGPLCRMREVDFAASVEVWSLVLDRFPKAEPPSVPGLDWLPAVEADAAVLVAEAVAVLDEPKAAAYVDNTCVCGHWLPEHVTGVCMTEVGDNFCPCGMYVRAES